MAARFHQRRRYNVHPGEVRDRVCRKHGISRRQFQRLLSDLHESRDHYLEFELIGAPPHATGQHKRAGMAMQIGGVWYSYIVLHLRSK